MTAADTIANSNLTAADVGDSAIRVHPVGPGIDTLVGAELSAIGRYYDRVIEWRGSDERVGEAASSLALRVGEEGERRTLIVVDARGQEGDVARCLAELEPVVARTTRVAIVTRGPLANVVFRSAKERSFAERKTTMTREWQVVRTRPVGYIPWRLAGAGAWLNRALAGLPLVRWACRATVTVWRPIVPEPPARKPSLSIVVPARNERGNIGHVLERLPDFGGTDVEVIFVEGHSTDGTWEEIERVMSQCEAAQSRNIEAVADLVRVPTESAIDRPTPHEAGCDDRPTSHEVSYERCPTSREVSYGSVGHSCHAVTVRALRQTGRGKADAVRLGFSQAKGELLTILDADLTTPPESLAQFYETYCDGRADFINGDRLTLPMERGAMRVLNKWGNRFFAWAVGRTLDTRLGDCLCGTKLLARHDWARFAAWRERFGDRDPFGDFDLLFPAAALAIGIADLPVRYAARTYGATNIRRFRDGWRLARMTWAAWRRIRAGAGEMGCAGVGEMGRAEAGE